MLSTLKVESFTGTKIHPLIPEIAKLRIEIFLEYPFLYQGDMEYENDYLKKFMCMEDAIVVVAFDESEIVGISTGYPFKYELDVHQQLFISKRKDIHTYFSFGESVLKKQYRGQGIGHQFFDHREAHVNSLDRYKHICFYTSTKPKKDPHPPQDYISLAPFWTKRGYHENADLVDHVSYKGINEEVESEKEMIFWTKQL